MKLVGLFIFGLLVGCGGTDNSQIGQSGIKYSAQVECIIDPNNKNNYISTEFLVPGKNLQEMQKHTELITVGFGSDNRQTDRAIVFSEDGGAYLNVCAVDGVVPSPGSLAGYIWVYIE